MLSLLYTGSALATTAIGTLIPVLRDVGQLRTRLGTYLLAAGAVGEFGPVLLITLALSAESTVHNALILIAFVAVVVLVAVLVQRSASATVPLFERTLESSAQLAVRWIVVLVFALAFLAFKLGLDLLLGGFAAGLITRQLLEDRELPAFESKLTAIGFGVFVPFFFVVSGMKLDVHALVSSGGAVAKLFLFLGAVPGRARNTGDAALPPRAQPPRTRLAGVSQRHPAATGRRDHRPRDQHRPHAPVDGSGLGRRGGPVDVDLPGRRLADRARSAVTADADGQVPGAVNVDADGP